MNPSRALHPLGDALPVALAALWPLGVYTQIPLTPVWLSYCTAIAMLCIAAVRWRKVRAARPPFEYWWPCAVVVLVFAAAIPTGNAADYAVYLVDVGFFLGPVILVQNRETAARACAVFSIAGALAACLNSAATMGMAPPTSIHLDYGIALSGPTNFYHGVLAIVATTLAGVFAASHPALPSLWRWPALGAAVCTTGWLLWLALHVAPFVDPLQLRFTSWKSALLLLLALWTVARVMARGLLRGAAPGLPGRGWAPALLATATVVCIAWGVTPGPALFLFLGLLAAHDAPWANDNPVTTPRPLWAFGIACVAIQVLGVVPLATTDPRNQAARCEDLLEQQDWESLDEKLAFLLELQPGRPALTLLRARSLAAQGWPESAAAAYCSTAYPDSGSPNLGLPLKAHERALLDTLRDQASRLPQGDRSLFFERALIHSGKTENALEFLALHTKTPRAPLDTPSEPLAWAIALLAGEPALASQLSTSEAGVLQGYLEGAGVAIDRLPPLFPEALGPVLLRYIAGPDGMSLEIWRGAGENPLVEHFRYGYGSDDDGPRAATPPQWNAWSVEESGAWALRLNGADTDTIAVLHVEPPENRFTVDFTKSPPPTQETQAAALFIP